MSQNNNPWATEESQGSPFQQNNQYGQPQTGQQQGQHQQYQQHPSQHQQQQQGGAAAGYYGSQPNQPQTQQTQRPPQGGRPGDTESFLATQPDRGEQFERMQQFEAHATESQDDKNQAQLQKEYPNLDSSLIAAIYNERKPDMGEVRELLQELNSS